LKSRFVSAPRLCSVLRSGRSLAAPLTLLLLVAGFAVQEGGVPPGFTRIFNGRDMTGWHVSRTNHSGTTLGARAEDGAIVLHQSPYGQGGVLLTNRKYRDFELYLEVKPAWGTNGGILLRSTETGSAYQVELAGDGGPTTGNLLGERLAISKGAEATNLAAVWKPGDWNSFRVRVVGAIPHITLWVNGTQMWDVVQSQNDLLGGDTDGFVAFQTNWTNTFTPVPDAACCPGNWRPGAVHRFRNIAIKELE
jgi:hypothetical protein